MTRNKLGEKLSKNESVVIQTGDREVFHFSLKFITQPMSPLWSSVNVRYLE